MAILQLAKGTVRPAKFFPSLAGAAFALLSLSTPALAETCGGCHDGSDPNAPNVYTYWDGTWAGPNTIQNGGHGDPDGLPALTCEGATGCHDLTGAATHNNGILETAGNAGPNTAHLKSSFMAGASTPPYAVAQTFNTTCATECHSPTIPLCGGHESRSGIPYTPKFGAIGDPNLDADGSDGPRGIRYWVDTDISTSASLDSNDYVLCVSCHDPHGTGVVMLSRAENCMARDKFAGGEIGGSALCMPCHGLTDAPPPIPSSVSASDLLYSDHVTLGWNDVSGETGYRIYRSSSRTGPFDLIATRGADVTAFDDPLACSEAFFYSVTSYRMGVESGISYPERGATSACGAPTPLTVCPSGCDFSSIQTAVAAAFDGDTVIVGPGTYSGPVDFAGKAIAVLSTGGPAATIIDAGGSGSAVLFASGEGAGSVLDGFTLTGGTGTVVDTMGGDDPGTCGGGVYGEFSSPTIRNCVVAGNSSPDRGGGIYFYGSAPSIAATIVRANSSLDGGGLFFSQSTPELVNLLVSGNRAAGGGGGLTLLLSDAKVANCTVASNAADADGGAGIRSEGSSPVVVNTVLWGNERGGLRDQIWESAPGAATVAWSDVEGGDPGAPGLPWPGPGNIDANPLFAAIVPASSAPSAAGDYRLLGASPCVDGGTGDTTTYPFVPDTDFEGDARPEGPGHDMGFDEFHGGGRDDVLIGFGAGLGLWVNYDDDPAAWGKIHVQSPDAIAVGDLDGNGQDDVVLNFGAGQGVWVNYNNDAGAWRQLHPSSPELMALGDLDGNGRDDAVLDFGPAFGIWVNYNDDPASWLQLHASTAAHLAAGDLNGNGKDDVVIDFGAPFGVWVSYDNGSWRQVHQSSAAILAVGDIDGDGRDDVVLDIPATGLWVGYNDDPSSMVQIHPSNAELVEVGDIDGSGGADLVLDFGAALGVWANYDGDPGAWAPIHAASPETMALGDLDGGGVQDVIFDFGVGTGLWVNYNDDPAAWRQIHVMSPELLATGNTNAN